MTLNPTNQKRSSGDWQKETNGGEGGKDIENMGRRD